MKDPCINKYISVSNISFQCQFEEFCSIASHVGSILTIDFFNNREGFFIGKAVIQYINENTAYQGIQYLNGKIYGGRSLIAKKMDMNNKYIKTYFCHNFTPLNSTRETKINFVTIKNEECDIITPIRFTKASHDLYDLGIVGKEKPITNHKVIEKNKSLDISNNKKDVVDFTANDFTLIIQNIDKSISLKELMDFISGDNIVNCGFIFNNIDSRTKTATVTFNCYQATLMSMIKYHNFMLKNEIIKVSLHHDSCLLKILNGFGVNDTDMITFEVIGQLQNYLTSQVNIKNVENKAVSSRNIMNQEKPCTILIINIPLNIDRSLVTRHFQDTGKILSINYIPSNNLMMNIEIKYETADEAKLVAIVMEGTRLNKEPISLKIK